MPRTKNVPEHKRKKDGKPHKNKDCIEVRLPCIPRDISVIRGDLVDEYFNHVMINPYDFFNDTGMQYLSTWYSPKENKIYLYAKYLGSGWEGSPTEFMTWESGWRKVTHPAFTEQRYLPFIETRNGAVLGYDIFKVPTIYRYYEY